MSKLTVQEALECFLAENRSLEDLVRSGGDVLEVVVQDEFTHDVIAWVPTRAGVRLAVFDST
ncbi:MAG: hypothetical protein AAFZ18_07975 [Myxococcota bacterium]